MANSGNSDSSITSQRIAEEFERLSSEKGAFIGKSAVGWLQYAETLPVQKRLFGDLWFENEIVILFADTNVGKTILAVQIADSISRGREIKGFALETAKQKVLYFDFEQTAKQFAARYSKDGEAYYKFDNNFIRLQPNNDADIPDSGYDSYLIGSIEVAIVDSGAKVVIVDNLTFLKSETEKSKNATPLIRHLKQLKDRYSLSMMILAHTPKRDSSRPITKNDLQGSKAIMNLIDSCFALGDSCKDRGLRYIKHLKSRNAPIIFDESNVCILHLVKPHNFLKFEVVGTGSEYEHIMERTDEDRAKLEAQVLDLHFHGKSYREIQDALGCSHMTALRIVKKHSKKE